MRQNKILTSIFLLITLLPLLDMFFNFSPVKELFEKRLPVQKPKFSLSANYPKNFEKYFDDSYGFRKSLILLHSQLMDKIFDESLDARVVVGKDDWFYFDNYNSLVDAQGLIEIPDEVINRAIKSFYKNWQMLRAKNIDYLLVIAADKSTIYPEFLPDYIRPADHHRIDKFLNALKKSHPDFPLLDLRPILSAAKKNEIIYQKTDTHWNRRGAHYAYVEIMKKVGIKSHPRSDFENKEDEMMRGDISDIRGSDDMNLNYDLREKFVLKAHKIDIDVSLRNFHRAMVWKNEDNNLPRLFVYKDSFFGDLINFISEHFSQSIYINEFPCDLNYEIIKNMHPNLVIQEFWEGRVEVVLSGCANHN